MLPVGYLFCTPGGAQNMPKTTTTGKATEGELPIPLLRPRDKAQQTFAQSYDSAIEQYGGHEQRAHQGDVAPLKHTHEKVGDRWEPKEEDGPCDAQPQGGKNTSRPTVGGVDANASKKAPVRTGNPVGRAWPIEHDRAGAGHRSTECRRPCIGPKARKAKLTLSSALGPPNT
jgi:hypothetical protein